MQEKIISCLGEPFKSYAQIIEAVCHAAKVAEDIRTHEDYGRLTKSDSSPVTVADLAVQMIIVNALQVYFPQDSIIAEEDPSSLTDENIMAELGVISQKHGFQLNQFEGLGCIQGNRCWTIDPIDGTKGFLRNGQYAICLALIQDDKVVASFIACPNLELQGWKGYLYCALSGQGAYEVPLNFYGCTQLLVGHQPLEGSVMVESYEAAHTSHQLSEGLREALHLRTESLRLDSQCKYCLVARGDAAVYLRKPRAGYQEKIWDHAPGSLMVEETGGQMTDFAGKPILFSLSRTIQATGGIVATRYSRSDHAKLVDYLKNHSP